MLMISRVCVCVCVYERMKEDEKNQKMSCGLRAY